MPRKNYLFLIIAFVLIFGFGFWVGKEQVICKICAPEKVDMSLLWEAWDRLQNNFVDPKALDAQQMIYGAIAGLVKSLKDPYTVFFTPDETKKFLEDVGGRFEGIGAEIGKRKDQLQIVSPLENTPAKRAGLRPGDKIMKINDTVTAGLSVEEAVSLIRGPKDTQVTLTILREGWDAPKEFKITRALIEVPSLKSEILPNDIAYIKIYQFSENANSDFTQTAVQILNGPAKKIILDLRDDPGGYLEVAQNLAGWFLERGQTVVTESFGRDIENIVHKAEGNAKFLDYPMVVLINKGSASAAEILAAALSENRQIKLIGETSFGKGSVQRLETLRDGSTIKITIARWLTPKGNQINEVGLKPDIEVELTEADYSAEKDPQLDKAIEILNNLR